MFEEKASSRAQSRSSLARGARLGSYEIESLLGSGGMGEVYRARDTRLGRTVAIKVLPARVAGDGARRRRFETEARAISQISHPHICALYDVGEAETVPFLVMEYLDGQTLADRLKQKPLSVADTLQYATQIADALDAAHRRGIVHGDLKPANVMLTKGGVRLLDFGLARISTSEVSDIAIDAQPSAVTATVDGVVRGTLPYLSPELLEGGKADVRSDIFAFGAVLYEMLTGRRAFAGASESATVAAILETHPAPLDAEPATIPPALTHVVTTCLAKDPDERWQNAGDLQRQLAWIAKSERAPARSAVAAVGAAIGKRMLVISAVTAISALLTAVVLWNQSGRDSQARMVTRFTAALPADLLLPAVSRDGSQFAFVVMQGNERGERIYVRRMDQSEAKPIQGTANAAALAFSPDGEWITFVARPGFLSQLKKVHLVSGAVQTLVDDAGIPPAIPVSWGDDNHIYFTSSDRLLRVASEGGTPQTLLASDSKDDIERVYFPQPLPGGRSVLFTVSTASSVDSGYEFRVAVLNVETGRTKVLLEAAGMAHYAPAGSDAAAGHIVYERGGALFAVPFDANRLVVKGSPVRVLEGVGNFSNSPAFAVSNSGTLVYGAGSSLLDASDTLVWVDRQGKELPLSAPPLRYATPRLSPRGDQVALSVVWPGGAARSDLGVYDLVNMTLTRLTSEGNNSSPVWTPDGNRLIYLSRRAGANKHVQSEVTSLPADGSESPLVLLRGELEPKAVSHNRGVLLLHQSTPKVWFAQVIANGLPSPANELRPFLESPSAGGNMTFSPDGRWVAYDSSESGGARVYVVPYPGPGGKWQVSTSRGWGPRWSHSGREIFYRDGDSMMSVKVETSPAFRFSTPSKLFDGRYGVAYDANFAVAPDDQRFLMIKPNAARAVRTLDVVLNWTDELKRLVPMN